jgi:hypothetical protein
LQINDAQIGAQAFHCGLLIENGYYYGNDFGIP